MDYFETNKKFLQDYDNSICHIIKMTHICTKSLDLYSNKTDVFTKNEVEDYSILIRKLYWYLWNFT